MRGTTLKGKAAVGLAVGALVLALTPHIVGAALSGPPSRWTSDPQPPVSAGTLDYLTCFSATDCVAFGSNGKYHTRVLWNGTTWTKVRVLHGTGGFDFTDSSLDCLGADYCVAVGDTTDVRQPNQNTTPAVEVMTNHGYTLQSVPKGTDGPYILNGISCASHEDCTAYGDYFMAGRKDMAVHYDGKRWALEPFPSNRVDSALEAVSCVSGDHCVIVGGLDHPDEYVRTDGRWVRSAIGLSGQNAVSCSSATACEAVGGPKSGVYAGGGAEGFNGTTWVTQPTYAPPTSVPQPTDLGTTTLSDVSCVSVDDCTAVGEQETSIADESVAEGWNGKRWSYEPSGTFPGELNSVSCPTADFCAALGDDSQFGVDTSVVEFARP